NLRRLRRRCHGPAIEIDPARVLRPAEAVQVPIGTDVHARVRAIHIAIKPAGAPRRPITHADPANVLSPDESSHNPASDGDPLRPAVSIAPVGPAPIFAPGEFVRRINIGLAENSASQYQNGDPGQSLHRVHSDSADLCPAITVGPSK